MVECEVSFIVQDASVVKGGAVVELVEGYNIVGIGIGQGQMPYQPAGAVIVRNCCCHLGAFTYMKPAPPVIMIFLTSGNGSYFVVPVKTGASFQTPKSSKNRFGPVEAVVAMHANQQLFPLGAELKNGGRTSWCTVCAILGCHSDQLTWYE